MGHHLGDYRCDTVLEILGDQLNGNGKQRSRRGVEDIEEGPLIIVTDVVCQTNQVSREKGQ